MNKRQLVIDTINHKKRDVVPYQLDLTNDVKKRLEKELNQSDFEKSSGNYLATERNESFTVIDENRVQDMFGAVWLKDKGGDFGFVENYQLKEPTLSDYSFPQPDETLIRLKCERLTDAENMDLFKLYIIGFSLFERAWSLRGMEELLVDFILNPDFVVELFDRIVEYNIGVMDIVMEYPIDGIFFGDDWGQQKGLIMGPKHWRKYIKPQLNKMYTHVKNKGLYIAQHSCGDISELFPDLIQIGLDIYNTFQPEIYDVKKIKESFGDKLTFYGGISTQHVLPYGTPDEVKTDTRRMMDVMARDGGYIVAPTHSIPNDVPTKNILAFLEVVQNQ